MTEVAASGRCLGYMGIPDPFWEVAIVMLSGEPQSLEYLYIFYGLMYVLHGNKTSDGRGYSSALNTPSFGNDSIYQGFFFFFFPGFTIGFNSCIVIFQIL